MGVKVPAHYRPKVTSAILSSWVVHNLVNRESHPCRVGCKRRSYSVPLGRLKRRLTALENWTVRHIP